MAKRKRCFIGELTLARTSPSFFSVLKQEVPFAVGSLPFIWQCFFFYLPLFFLIIYSTIQTGDVFPSFTLHYFQSVLTATYFKVIFRSLFLSCTTTLLCLSIGFPLAYCMVMHGKKLKNFFLFLLIIPFWTNFILHIYAWFFVLEKDGFLNTLLLKAAMIKEPIHFLNTSFATFLMMFYFYLPFMTLPIFSSLERFDPLILEASLDLGANKRQTLQRILIPIIIDAIKSGIYLVFIPSFGEFVIPELMGGAKHMFIGNAISLLVLDHHTTSIGIAFTVISIITLLFVLFLLHIALKKVAKKLTWQTR